MLFLKKDLRNRGATASGNHFLSFFKVKLNVNFVEVNIATFECFLSGAAIGAIVFSVDSVFHVQTLVQVVNNEVISRGLLFL